MKTIRLALTDNKDFRLVNVELPEEPLIGEYGFGTTLSLKIDYQTDHINWQNEVKRLVDSCPVVSDTEMVYEAFKRSIKNLKRPIIIKDEIIPYHIYELVGWQGEVKAACCGMLSSPEWIQNHGLDNPYKEEDTRGKETHDLCGNSCMPIQVSILSKIESEEKEEPKEEGYEFADKYKIFIAGRSVVEAPVKVSDDIDPLGGMQPTQVKDVFSRSEVREEIRKAFKAGERYGSQVSTKGNIIDYLKENGF